MTLEEFKNKLNLNYTFGITRADGASRRYHDKEMNIGSELHTPKDKYGNWGKGERIYYFEDDKREFETLEELFTAWENGKRGNNE